ncbi:MAG: GlsB/YeaQ/YmgE family stress response membrane protein [Clostridiales bacterium]|nr:GlsB/YeaQ/YmgE family stress response membrane protein [Clostridiales bacterium]
MGLISWLVFGALAGWIGSMIMGKSSSMGAVANIVVGVVGAGIGGFVASLMGLGTISGFNFYSMLIAIGGACILLFIVGMVQKSRV